MDSGKVTYVSATPRDHVPALARHMRERMAALGYLNAKELAEAADVSATGLKPLLEGERRSYRAPFVRKVTAALRWTPDSIDRILGGRRPIEVDGDGAAPRPPDSLDDRLARIEARLDRIEEQNELFDALSQQVPKVVASNARKMAALAKTVEELRGSIPPPPPPPDPTTESLELSPGLAP